MSLKANQLFYYEYLGEFVITAYSSTPEETDSTPFITASNKRVRDGFIACPRYMKFGTRVVIDGKSYVCEDVMNERYSKHFDIWFSTRSEAIKFGRVIKKVYAIK